MRTARIGILGLLFLALVFIGNAATAGENSKNYDCLFYQAFITGDMSQWPVWIDQLEQNYKKTGRDDALRDIVKAQYGYVAYLIGVEKEERAERHIEESERYINLLKTIPSYRSYAEAMHGAFIAFRIGISKAKAIYLGPMSMNHIKMAIERDPDNPYAWVERGNAEYHMPHYFGGSYDTAAEYFREAVSIFEEEQSKTKCNWVYMNALAWLAQSYANAGKEKKAEQTFKKILSIEQDFKWVKEELYPEFKETK